MSDAAAARELEATPMPLPAGLEIEWLGVSGCRLTFEGVSIFIDPFVSKPPLRNRLLRRVSLSEPSLKADPRPQGPLRWAADM